MTLRLTVLLLVTALLASCEPYRPPSDWPEPSPALWEVQSPAGQRGWIFGTVHALPDGLGWGTPLLDETFESAGVVVVEVADLDTADGAELYATLSETPGQPPLTARVAAGQRAGLQQLMTDADMAEADFATMETWAAALTLSGAVREGDPLNGVDRALIALSDEAIGLESTAQQLQLFDRLSPAAQAELLEGVARAHAAGAEEAMQLAWLTGDEMELARHVNAAMEASPELKRVLLHDRNARWVERIAALIDGGRAPFVGVGAGHVVGDEGLIALLAARGYRVRRIQ